MGRGRVYLDHAATTPVDPRVAAAMAECLTADGDFAKPSSRHAPGRAAHARVELARAQVARLVGCEPAAIIFTSGATEGDYLAILGAARGNRDRGRHVVAARTEHRAVLDACRQLESEGFEVTRLRPGPDGRVTPAQVEAALRPDTVLVTLLHANNEIGVVQDVGAVGALGRRRGILVHADAAQSVGKIPVDVEALQVDLLSFTAHKLYGPKGVGALYVRRSPRPTLLPLQFGGGQEQGLRPGTLPTHQIAGFGLACELAAATLAGEAVRLAELRDRLWARLAVYKMLREGGEFFFSDIYADRRVPPELKRHPVLYGECLAGALYWKDFERIARSAGFRDPRVFSKRVVQIDDEEIQALVGAVTFSSITYRLWKLEGLEDGCEDYGRWRCTGEASRGLLLPFRWTAHISSRRTGP